MVREGYAARVLRHTAYTRERLRHTARRLAGLAHRERRTVDRILMAGPTDRIGLDAARRLEYRPVELGEQLGPQWATFWFRVAATVPEAWAGERVDLLWTTHSESTLWLDGRAAQGLNTGGQGPRPDALLVTRADGGERLELELEVACDSTFSGSRSSTPRSRPPPRPGAARATTKGETVMLNREPNALLQATSSWRPAARRPPASPAARRAGPLPARVQSLRRTVDHGWTPSASSRAGRRARPAHASARRSEPEGRPLRPQLLAELHRPVLQPHALVGRARHQDAVNGPGHRSRCARPRQPPRRVPQALARVGRVAQRATAYLAAPWAACCL